MFQTAAQQWASTEITGDSWNQSESTLPFSFGTYPPVLLYAGPNVSLCGAPAAVSQQVDLVQAGFLPSNFAAAYSGEYCAMIYPDSGTVQGSGPIGANGGTNLVAASTALIYFVAGTATDSEGILQNAPAQFVTSHLGSVLASHFSGSGTVMEYTPPSGAGGAAGGTTWQSSSP